MLDLLSKEQNNLGVLEIVAELVVFEMTVVKCA